MASFKHLANIVKANSCSTFAPLALLKNILHVNTLNVSLAMTTKAMVAMTIILSLTSPTVTYASESFAVNKQSSIQSKAIVPVFDAASISGQDFLQDILASNNANGYLDSLKASSHGKELEDACRIHTFGSTIHVTLNALSASTESVQNHLTTFVTEDQQNASRLWVHGEHRLYDTKKMDAQGISYGNELVLNGTAIGIDNRYSDNSIYGAALNLGSGIVFGVGSAAGSVDEFNYYGASLYGAYRTERFDLIGLVTYVRSANEVGNLTPISLINADIDTKVFSAALQAGTKLELSEQSESKLSIRPYVGLRVTQIIISDAIVVSPAFGKISTTKADDLSMISVPVGTALSYEELGDRFNTKLSLDLGAQVNTADKYLDTTTVFSKLEDEEYQACTEVASDLIYSAKLNVTTTYDNLSILVNVGYGRSSDGSFAAVGLNGEASLKF